MALPVAHNKIKAMNLVGPIIALSITKFCIQESAWFGIKVNVYLLVYLSAMISIKRAVNWYRLNQSLVLKQNRAVAGGHRSVGVFIRMFADMYTLVQGSVYVARLACLHVNVAARLVPFEDSLRFVCRRRLFTARWRCTGKLNPCMHSCSPLLSLRVDVTRLRCSFQHITAVSATFGQQDQLYITWINFAKETHENLIPSTQSLSLICNIVC